MSKKYFDYGFQVKRTKWGLIALIIVIIIMLIIFATWYNNRTVTEHLEALTYKTYFGVNEFESRDCNKAYRINYKKSTCGTVCISTVKSKNDYLDELKKSMEDDGFLFNSIATKKIGNETWNYLRTEGTDPIMNYYAVNTNKLTYVVEYIDQTSSLDKNTKNKCNDIINKVEDSFILND